MNMIYVLYGIIVMWIVETVLLLLFTIRTPAWTFLNVSMTGKKLLIEKLRGGPFYRFKSAKREGSTALRSKGKPDAIYFTTPNSMMISENGKLQTYFVASKSSFTTNFDFQMLINAVEKKIGKPVKDYNELGAALQQIYKDDAEFKLKLPAYTTIPLRDLDYYLPKYLNYEDVDAKISFLAKKLSLLDKWLNGKNVMLMVIILIGGAIAYTIITKDTKPVVNLIVENGTRLIEVGSQGGGAPSNSILGFVNNSLMPT